LMQMPAEVHTSSGVQGTWLPEDQGRPFGRIV
jgi:hypothetical protein